MESVDRWLTILVSALLAASCTTKPTVFEIKLPVKYHHQEHALSCEAAALKMVFDFYGLGVSESEILRQMPFDETPHNGNVWGDPDAAFVGDIDGKMGLTGYGIHWKALMRLASRWKKSEAIESGTLRDIAFQLEHGRPVIVWGYRNSREKLEWKTQNGRSVIGLKDEHARVVYGYRGKPGSPEGFFLMDPESGPIFWTAQAFLENWASLGDSAVVVYR